MTQEILASIDVLPGTASYWFIRTDGGKYFNTFFENKFIGIGWNEISLADLDKPESVVKERIFLTQKLDSSKKKDRTRATDIYNKLIRFKGLRKNDVIVIPSENSEYLGFGIIEDDSPFQAESETLECEYLKRRKINWIVDYPKRFDSVDDVFYKIRKSRHSISNVDLYASHIDSAMYRVYQKVDKGHFVVNVGNTGEINWLELVDLLKEMHSLMGEINLAFGLNEDIVEGTIQIALQSPGFFNLGQKGVSILLLATILGATGCSTVEGNLKKSEQEKLKEFKTKHESRINSALDTMKKMEVRL